MALYERPTRAGAHDRVMCASCHERAARAAWGDMRGDPEPKHTGDRLREHSNDGGGKGDGLVLSPLGPAL